MRRLLVVLAAVLAVARAGGKFTKRYDSDFLFEEDDWKQKKQKPLATKTWIWDPENGLCSALQCRSSEMCLLEDAFSAVCVGRDQLKQGGDRIVSRQLAEDEHIIKSQPWLSDDDDFDDDDDEYDDDIDLDDDDDDDEDYAYDDDEEEEEDEIVGDVLIEDVKKETPCRECPYSPPTTSTYICGTDNRTYSSLCRLEQHNCVHSTYVTTDCKGFCPCKDTGSYRKRKQMLRDKITKNNNRYKSSYSKEKLKKKYEDYHKQQKTFNDAKFYTKSAHKSTSSQLSTECYPAQLQQMGARLLDWFAVLQDGGAGRRQLHVQHSHPYSVRFPAGCPAPVQWMFRHLDSDSDRQLSLSELLTIERDQPERPCLKAFLDHCDRDGDIFLSGGEWCRCFQNTADASSAPCSQRRRAAAASPAGVFQPSCDERGLYRVTQCAGDQCWCVDPRLGVEIDGSRAARGRTRCRADSADFHTEDADDEDNFILEGSGAGAGF